MRIGIVTTSYPRWIGDHAGSFVEGHADALRDLGHRVEVVAAGDDETPRDRAAEREEIEWRVELREAERRARERRTGHDAHTNEWRYDNDGGGDDGDDGDDDNGGHAIDLREGERRGNERRRNPIMIVDRSTIAIDGRVVDAPVDDHRAVRVPSRGLFYRGGAPEAFERSTWRAMVSAASFLPRFAATVAKRARNWDHIVAHWLAPSALAALPTRKPITAIAHGGDIYTLHRFGLLKPTLRALRGAKLVFVSEELRRIAGVDGLVQPMGIDLGHFASIGRAPKPIVLFVGRLVPIKGVDTLIEAMAHLPDLRLVIAGDGPERRALEARARRTNATFLGAVSTGHRDRLLREAGVVVVPSRSISGRSEGCPTIALEALATGVPVVATTGRANEIVAPDDPIALAQAIRRVMSVRQKTYELVEDLDWMRVAERLLRSE